MLSERGQAGPTVSSVTYIIFKINSAQISLDSLCKSPLLKCAFLEAHSSASRKVMLFI